MQNINDENKIHNVKTKLDWKRILLAILTSAIILFSGSEIYKGFYFVNRDGFIKQDFSYIEDYHLLVKTDIQKLEDIEMPEFDGEVNYETVFSKNPKERTNEELMYIAKHFIDIRKIDEVSDRILSKKLVDTVNILLESKYSLEYLSVIVVYMEEITNEKIVKAIDEGSYSERKNIKVERELLLFFQGIHAIENSHFRINKPTINIENVKFMCSRIRYTTIEMKKNQGKWVKKNGNKFSKEIESEISSDRFISYGDEGPGSFSGIYLKTYGVSSVGYSEGIFIYPSNHSVTEDGEYIFYREGINDLGDQLMQMDIHENGITNIFLATQAVTEEEFRQEREELFDQLIADDDIYFMEELGYILYGHTGRTGKRNLIFNELSIKGLYQEFSGLRHWEINEQSIFTVKFTDEVYIKEEGMKYCY